MARVAGGRPCKDADGPWHKTPPAPQKGRRGQRDRPPRLRPVGPRPRTRTKQVPRAGAPRSAARRALAGRTHGLGTVVGTRTLLASPRPSYSGRRRVAGAGRPGGSATPGRTRRRCRNGVRSGRPGGYKMPPHADDYLHLTLLVSLSGCTRGRRYWRVPEVLQCIGVNGGSRCTLWLASVLGNPPACLLSLSCLA